MPHEGAVEDDRPDLTPPAPFTDLDLATVDRERAAVFVAEFLVWWFEAGRVFYQADDGLQAFARDALIAVGGCVPAKRLLDAGDWRQQRRSSIGSDVPGGGAQ